jgi:threonine aldolase
MPVSTAVDLRSDTVTRPTAAMLEAMVRAEVGDDVFGDDPTVLALESRVATLAGKEAALFVPSGTMGNQLAVMAQTRPGDEVLLEHHSHIFRYEQGGVAANAGAQAHVYESERGAPPPDLIERVMAGRSHDDHVAALKLVCVENTHNAFGGYVVPIESLRALGRSARAAGLRVHLDGARLWNASVASGVPIREWAAVADTVMMCFSKGLGAPIGSILTGDKGTILAARRHRKRLGGGMRQAGILTAACLYALDHHVERLAEDHARARRLAEGISGAPGVRVPAPETSIVMVELADPGLDAQAVTDALAERGVHVLAFDHRRIRAIVHLDADDAGIDRAIEAFRTVLERDASDAAGARK